MKTTFGEYLRTTRLRNNLTLTQMGAKLEIDSGALSKIENGKKCFDEKKLVILAKEFNLNIKVLKNEYFSEKFALDLILNDCSDEVLDLVEEKVRILKEKNAKQLNIRF